MMKKELVIFGTGDFADIVADLAKRCLNYNIAGYIIDDEYYSSSEKGALPIVKLSELEEAFPPDKYCVAIGMIGQIMQQSRERVFSELSEKGYELPNLIHPSAVISIPMEKIGRGNVILENCVLEYGVQIGNCNIFWPFSVVAHHNTVGSYNNFSPGSTTTGNVAVGSHCFLGANCCIKNRVVIADFTLVGAGAYISKDTEKYGIYVPERAIKLDKSSLDINL